MKLCRNFPQKILVLLIATFLRSETSVVKSEFAEELFSDASYHQNSVYFPPDGSNLHFKEPPTYDPFFFYENYRKRRRIRGSDRHGEYLVDPVTQVKVYTYCYDWNLDTDLQCRKSKYSSRYSCN